MSKTLDLPIAPPLKKSLGPSFILLGLALGSGELILWPYLVSQYGLGIIWGGLVGITFQYFLNTEIMRYTLAWGESVFVGWRKWGKLIPAWFVFSTVIPWALPGFASSSATILNHVFPILPVKATAVFLLLITGVIISSGRTLYATMEKVQRTLLMVGVPFVAVLALSLAERSDWSELGRGLLGYGDGWRFFPVGIAIGSFLGAFAYSGGGGNLNLAQSYYIKEKGFGMGAYSTGIKSLLQGNGEAHTLTGRLFALNAGNMGRWSGWWRLIKREHAIVFWGVGLLAILLLALLSAATTHGLDTKGGLSFFFAEGARIGVMTHPLIGSLFMVVGALMLFTTQLGVIESATRITAENALLLTHNLKEKVRASSTFYIFLWMEIFLGIIYLAFFSTEPRALLTLGAVLNAAAMMVAFPLILFLNCRTLPPDLRPSQMRRGILITAALFFLYFVIQTIKTASWR